MAHSCRKSIMNDGWLKVQEAAWRQKAANWDPKSIAAPLEPLCSSRRLASLQHICLHLSTSSMDAALAILVKMLIMFPQAFKRLLAVKTWWESLWSWVILGISLFCTISFFSECKSSRKICNFTFYFNWVTKLWR